MVNYREGLNTDDIRPRSELMVTTVAHDISLMKEPVSKGSDQNNALRFGICIWIISIF